MLSKRAAAMAIVCAILAVSCSPGSNNGGTTSTGGRAVRSGRPFPPERCAANKAAGKITYLSGFDFAASASIVDVLVAKQKGYFDALCLNVDVQASLSNDNYPLVAANQAQFASSGSFSEIATFAIGHPDAKVVVLAVEGKTANDALIVKAGEANTLDDLRGTTIGVKGTITPSVRAMLAKAGLIDGIDYRTAAIDGFDPIVHISAPDIVGFTGYASNEPGRLDPAGIKYKLFVPSADGIPGSFGILYSNSTFIKEHPTAAQDFMRASMHGLSDAIANPAAASMIALDFIDNSGNRNALSPDAENYRWQTESKLVTDSTPATQPVGLPDPVGLRNEIAVYAKIGLFGGTAANISALYDVSVVKGIYDPANKVIWPTK